MPRELVRRALGAVAALPAAVVLGVLLGGVAPFVAATFYVGALMALGKALFSRDAAAREWAFVSSAGCLIAVAFSWLWLVDAGHAVAAELVRAGQGTSDAQRTLLGTPRPASIVSAIAATVATVVIYWKLGRPKLGLWMLQVVAMAALAISVMSRP